MHIICILFSAIYDIFKYSDQQDHYNSYKVNDLQQQQKIGTYITSAE